MATRLYLPSSGTPPAGFEPAVMSEWDVSSLLARLPTSTTKSGSPMATVSFVDANSDEIQILFRQFISAPLTAGQTITGGQALEFQIRALEANAANNLFTQLRIRVIDEDGTTVNKEMIAGEAGGRDDTEIATTLVNRRFTANSAATNYTTQTGDRLVIEIGVFGNPSGAGTHSSSLRIGDAAASDLAEDDTDTDDDNPWVELTDTLTFDVGTAHTQDLAGTLTTAGTPTKHVSKAIAGALTTAGAVVSVFVFFVSLAGTLTSSGALTRVAGKGLAGALSMAGAITKLVGKGIAGTLTTAGTAAKTAAKAIAGTLLLAGAVTKLVGKALAGTLSFVGSVVRSTLVGVVNASYVPTAELGAGYILTTGYNATYIVTAAFEAGYSITKALAAEYGPTLSLEAERV